jgi:very-short-patch-repair endonuclease
MRANPTHEEATVWDRLRLKRADGFRFRQQAIIFGFICDFYCPKCKLVVEIDGGCHADTEDYDRMRTAKFERAGLRVLRFTNDRVNFDLDAVLAEIKTACHTRIR